MGLLRDLQSALKESLDELLKSHPQHDEVDEVTSLLEADLAEARSELGVAMSDEKRLKARIDQEMRDADRLKQQAQQAVDKNDDDAGREFIRRRRRSLRGVEILEQQWTEHQQVISLLADHIEELEDKLQEVRLRRDFLRSRGRVRALKERYERYRRDFGLDPPTLADEFELNPPQDLAAHDADPPEEPQAEPPEPRRRRGRRAKAESSAEEHGRTDAVSGLGEIPAPPPAGAEPELRRRHEADGDPELPPEADFSPWDRPPRDLRLEKERLLRQIERRQRSHEAESDLEDELAQMKAKAGRADADEPAAEPTRRPEPPAGGAVEGKGDEPGAGA